MLYQKIKRIGAALALILTGTLVGCNNNANNNVGIETLPEYMRVSALSKKFLVDLKTVSADLGAPDGQPSTNTSMNKMYVNSSYGYLGDIPNEEFGGVSSEYLTQFYCPPHFKFREEPIKHRIDSAFITLYYDGYSGDSIQPLEISAYKLQKALPFSKYSISDISPYVDQTQAPLGYTSFYASQGHGATYSQDRNATSQRFIRIPIPTELGQEFYDKSRADDPVFSSQKAFDSYFPGVYLNVSAGRGSVIKVVNTSLSFFYTVLDSIPKKGSPKDARDSVITVTRVQELSHTTEVPQLSRFVNQKVDYLANTNPDDGYVYIKSPAGVLTEVTIPTVEIKALLDAAPEGYERNINSITMTILGEKQEDGTYALKTPTDLLMLPKDSVASFFQRELTTADAPYTSFISQRALAGSLAYDFGNISSVVQEHIKNKPTEDLVVWLVPVEYIQIKPQNSYSNQPTLTSISNLVLPTAMKISTEEKNRQITAIITQKKVGKPF